MGREGSWIRKDVGWRRHDKMKLAIHLAGGGREGRQVKWLWDEALSESNDLSLDGIIASFRLPEIVEQAGLTASKGKRFIPALVASGLWHTAETVGGCDPCSDFLATRGRALTPGVGDVVGDVLFHDIEDYQQLRDRTATPELKSKELQRLAMRANGRLRELIYARDEGMCRYCGFRVTTNPHDHRSGGRLTHDHVDPHAGLTDEDRGNNLDNVVLACADCNEAKGQRTPDEAGMTLWAPGSNARDIATGVAMPFDPSTGELLGGDRTGSGTVRTEGRSWVGPGSLPGRFRDGTGKGRRAKGSARSPTSKARAP